MKDQREKFKKQFHLPSFFASQRIKYLGINLPKEIKELYRESYRTLMKEVKDNIMSLMKRYSMFLGRKNQYCENDCTNKCNLQIQCDPYQITNGIFYRTRTKNFTIHMETQKTLNSQNSLEKE